MAKNFYVYGLFRPDNGLICYIGKGHGKRFEHSAKYGGSRNNSDLMKLIKKYGELSGAILFSGLTEKQALKREIELIAIIGRKKDGGPLVNITSGGQGGNDNGAGDSHWNKESHPQSGIAIGNALRGKPKSLAARKAMGKSQKKRDRSAGYSEEHAAAISAGVAKFWDRRRKQYGGSPPALRGKAGNKKHSKAMKAHYARLRRLRRLRETNQD
jgi:hypothetical protein